jgi:hypothetical protein
MRLKQSLQGRIYVLKVRVASVVIVKGGGVSVSKLNEGSQLCNSILTGGKLVATQKVGSRTPYLAMEANFRPSAVLRDREG